MKKEFKRTIPIFISHRGCPNDCIFCNQRKITGVTRDLTREEIIFQIDIALKTIPDDCIVELAFFGGSFTALKFDTQKELLEIAKKYLSSGKIDYVRISTRPDSINNEILDFLKTYGVEIIELGVQSMDDTVLISANRGHLSKVVYESSKLILKKGFKLGLQMMIGLPNDNEIKVECTVNEFIKIKPHFVRIYPVLVIKNTELESLFKNKLYEPWSIERAAKSTKNAYLKFKKNSIDVIRIGLQASDNINIGADIVAGPFHAAFGEIVYSLVFRDIMEKFLKEQSNSVKKHILVKIPKSKISQFMGNKKSNIKYFKEKFGIDICVKEISEENTIFVDEKPVDLKEYF